MYRENERNKLTTRLEAEGAALRRATRRTYALTAISLAALVSVLVLNAYPIAMAQTPGTSLTALMARLTSDEATISDLQTTVSSQAKQIHDLQTAVTNQGKITNLFTLSDGVGTNTELTLSRVNLRIVNGLGATNGEPSNPEDIATPTTNGLGNLIIGYNESRKDVGGLDARTGSHNLIAGSFNNYTGFGGMVIGSQNASSGAWSSVSGGQSNTASGAFSCVYGGQEGTASGDFSTVSGGRSNTASGVFASVSGGQGNTALGQVASVSGGSSNEANEFGSSVSGGFARHTMAGVIYGWAAGSQASSSFTAGNFSSP